MQLKIKLKGLERCVLCVPDAKECKIECNFSVYMCVSKYVALTKTSYD